MKYQLAELLDISRLQTLLDSLYLSSKIPSAIIDVDGKVLTGSGWQDVCTKFHRAHPDAERRCIESDRYIESHIHEANPSLIYRCPHGLVDAATPIVVEGAHLGNVFTGQLLFEPPDLDFFRAQAKIYRFDETPYIEAVKKVPVISEQAMEENLIFIANFTQMLAEMGLKKKKEMESERQLRESEERYRDLVEHSRDLICTHDLKGRLLSLNPLPAEILGYSREELLGTDMRNLVPQEFWDQFEQYLETIRENGVAEGLLIVLARNGERRIWKYRNTLRTEGVAEPIVRGMARDITERKKAESEVRRLEAQLQQAQKMEAVGRLAGGIAHDFNNLLTVINGYSGLLLAQLDEKSPLYREAEEIKQAGERAASLTRQLLAFSRKQVLQPKVLDLNEVVSGMGGMLRRLIVEDIDFQSDLGKELGSVKADPGQIEQVIVNLVLNARDAMPGGGRLVLSTANFTPDKAFLREHPSAVSGPHVILTVSDTGTGMSEEAKSHMFEPFFTTKEKGKGTGLGLSTVYGIVNQSGGHVSIDSEIGKGTTVRIYLPRVDADAEKLPELSDAALYGRELLLVVEDEDAVRGIVERVLSEKGYRVLSAGDGNEGLRLFEAHKDSIDLLITDVVMPGMGGRDLATRVESARPGMKVLYMSGYTDEAINRNGVLDAGLFFLQKPFTPGDLLRKVREVLDKQSGR